MNEVNAGIGKNFRVAQPLEIVTEQEAVHWRKVLIHSERCREIYLECADKSAPWNDATGRVEEGGNVLPQSK